MGNSTETVVAVDAEWRLSFASPDAGRTFVLPRQLNGQTLWQVWPELLGTDFEQDCRRAMRDRIVVRTESCLSQPDACFVVNIYPADGGGLWLVFQNATARRRNEDAAREQELRFRAIVEQVKDYAIFTADVQGRPTSWNEGVHRVLGFEESEFLGRDIAPIIFTPEDYERGVAQKELAQAAATGSANDDRWMRKKDGTLFFALGVTTSSRDEQGRLIGFMKVMRDQTERKKMEDELRRIAADLAGADHRKNEFLAMLAHELRNPLAPLSNALKILKSSPHDIKVVSDTCEIMDRQLRHLVRLVDDLLDVNRITRGRIDLRTSVIDLVPILEQTVEMSRPALETSGQQLTVSLPKSPVLVRGDAVRLAQVFSNLLNNASKYSDRGGNVWLTAERQGDEVAVSVKDNGVGIPMAMLPRVFDLFTQVEHSLDRSQGGLGIGLTLVKRLVELHGGVVHAFSEGVGQGCEFVIRLPVCSEVPQSSAPSADPPVIAARRILVVDDNRDSASTLAMLLRLSGNETRTANDGLEAIELADQFRPELVLLDIGLPRLSGYEVAQRIRQQPWGQNIVLIALTGWGQEDDRRKSKAAGFDAHLVKPLDQAALAKLLNHTTR